VASDKAIAMIVRLRLLVAVVGERLPRPWWRSQFLTPTGLRYLVRIFPRTYRAAAFASATVGARRDHDATLGTTCFHLFRLPADLEDQIARATFPPGLDPIPDSLEQVIAELDTLGTRNEEASKPGPRSFGPVKGITKPATVGALAFSYAQAAGSDQRIYPYFEAVGDD
jgi:hypothetical protein